MLSLRNQVLRQEGVNSVPDKGGKGGLNNLIILNYVFYIIFYNYILYIIVIV